MTSGRLCPGGGRSDVRITLHDGSPSPVLVDVEGDSQSHRMSMALFCPGCGDVWGRVHRGPAWYAMARWCGREPRCENDYAVPGSFFAVMESGVDCEAFLQFPEFLKREFEVQLRWAERRPIPGQQPSQQELKV